MNYTSEKRGVYRVVNGERQFIFEALTLIGAICAADELNRAAGAHHCSEHLTSTDHDLIKQCAVCRAEYA